MEIETKIFDTKKIRKVLKKKDIQPNRVCDITDYLFDIRGFSSKGWKYSTPKNKKSGTLSAGGITVEIPSLTVLAQIQAFLALGIKKGSKIRLRQVDFVPYITIKGPKITKKGIKSREEIETRVGSLSDMMQILLSSGAKLEKVIARVREIYSVPKHEHAELIIDRLESAHETLEYAELEAPSEEELHKILKKIFDIDPETLSSEGVRDLHDATMKKGVTRRITQLEEMIGE